ncbi:2-Hydroxyacid oxidase 2 isoform X3 [Hippopotamus amphibius kiboko]|uniref:2-Hydroxyacid oxidase 2 isoform X3 n=1 Tax=Hippopotamus amphibius kiboko TaxID=575201 RepID=UPI00259320C8|nr:2-Hydroxyacid oxidase 2 isoform X3 [Hippopotamus amphibius kiboko]
MSLVCLTDFEAHARKQLSKPTWDFIEGGADDCLTRDDNVAAFKKIRLRPRYLKDVSKVDMRTTIQGDEISAPICIAPTGFHCLVWPDGEMSTARAAQAAGVCYITSTYASCSLKDIVTTAPGGLRWFQLYAHVDRQLDKQLIQKENTVPYFQMSPIDPSICWDDLSWFQSMTRLPIILKGILTKEDAELAVKHNVHGIIVSNHGGRQLDEVPAAIDALAEVVAAVKGKMEVYMDGGVRTGNDVLKALALGAKCVFLGRPVLWGLAYKGEHGVEAVLNILKNEFHTCMTLTGCRSVAEISRDLIQFSRL